MLCTTLVFLNISFWAYGWSRWFMNAWKLESWILSHVCKIAAYTIYVDKKRVNHIYILHFQVLTDVQSLIAALTLSPNVVYELPWNFLAFHGLGQHLHAKQLLFQCPSSPRKWMMMLIPHPIMKFHHRSRKAFASDSIFVMCFFPRNEYVFVVSNTVSIFFRNTYPESCLK